MGVKGKATHPPFVPPIKGGIIFNSCSHRRPNLTLRKFKVAVVVRTLVRIGCKRTEVRATLKKLPKA